MLKVIQFFCKKKAVHRVHREFAEVPIYRRGKIASFKTSYSGVLWQPVVGVFWGELKWASCLFHKKSVTLVLFFLVSWDFGVGVGALNGGSR